MQRDYVVCLECGFRMQALRRQSRGKSCFDRSFNSAITVGGRQRNTARISFRRVNASANLPKCRSICCSIAGSMPAAAGYSATRLAGNLSEPATSGVLWRIDMYGSSTREEKREGIAEGSRDTRDDHAVRRYPIQSFRVYSRFQVYYYTCRSLFGDSMAFL